MNMHDHLKITYHIAGRIRDELESHGMTQHALAREMGVSEMWVSRRLHASDRVPVEFSMSELICVARILHVDVVDLLPYADISDAPMTSMD